MNVVINPSTASGKAVAPPSKSVAHRALICGALSGGSRIENVAFSRDISATLDCLKKMGADVKIEGSTVAIGGLDPFNLPENVLLDCNESGSTLRFLIPILLLSNSVATIQGSGRLMQRPLGIYEEIAAKYGFVFDKKDNTLLLKGRLVPDDYAVAGNVSSQFITGLLLALPLLEGDSKIVICGDFESASYVDITIAVLNEFGVKIKREGNEFLIPGGQSYCGSNYSVEGDCSNAAYLDVFNYLGSGFELSGVPQKTCQGDAVYKNIFESMKSGIGEFDLSDCPDLAPVLFAFAAALGGGFRFVGTARLASKESDRASAMKQELAKFGVDMDVEQNSVYIHRGKIQSPNEALLSHNDHRIVMALAALCSLVGGTIKGAEAVEKSFPDYFDIIKQLGIGYEIV